MSYLILSVFCCALFSGINTFTNKNQITGIDLSGDAGEPVYITPYIKSNQIKLAQNLTKVHGLLEGVESYSGYITVNETYDSNLFFWFFPATEVDPDDAPVILWLQGGPGASSLYGLFEEHGPFYLEKNGTLRRRQVNWSQLFNLIYIDNPVGTGFSFTRSDDGYAKDEVRVGDNLYSALLQFFQLFPNLQNNDFFITGESYAGKYVPAAAYAIHNYNKASRQKINLKGLAIGNGLCDPENMMKYGEYLYQIGLIDTNTRDFFESEEKLVIEDIRRGNYSDAFDRFDSLLNGDLIPSKSTFYNATGFSFYYNYLHNTDYSQYGDMNEFLQKTEIRRKIHVGNLTYNSGSEVEKHLKNDVMQSVKPWIEVLLENYRVMFYNGQLDIIVSYPLTINFIKNLKWSGADVYKTAERKQWRVGSDLAGYYKTAGRLTEVLVRNAGHMVPTDQPVWAHHLIQHFVFNLPL